MVLIRETRTGSYFSSTGLELLVLLIDVLPIVQHNCKPSNVITRTTDKPPAKPKPAEEAAKSILPLLDSTIACLSCNSRDGTATFCTSAPAPCSGACARACYSGLR